MDVERQFFGRSGPGKCDGIFLERFGERNVVGKESVVKEFASFDPGEFFVLQGRRLFALEFGADSDQSDVGGMVVDDAGRDDVGGELFSDLALGAGGKRFADFSFAAGEFPTAGLSRFIGAQRQKYPAMIFDDRRGYFYGFVTQSA